MKSTTFTTLMPTKRRRRGDELPYDARKAREPDDDQEGKKKKGKEKEKREARCLVQCTLYKILFIIIYFYSFKTCSNHSQGKKYTLPRGDEGHTIRGVSGRR